MRSWPLLLVVSLALLVGCASDSKKKIQDPDPSLYLAQTSIANVLENLKRAYQEMNHEEYRKLLDTAFEYAFAPQDVGGPNNIPASWGLPDDLLSAAQMFGHIVNRDGYFAEEITLSFEAGADTPTDLNPNWRKVVLSNVNLAVVGRNETSNDPLIYQVLGDKADLYLVLTAETAPGTNLRIWKIIRWEDKPISLRNTKTENTSWGKVRANWR